MKEEIYVCKRLRLYTMP